jgi:hypothetical protein
MPGKWEVFRQQHSVSIRYKDWTTGREWICGKAPADFPIQKAIEWIANQINACDLIVVDGQEFACAFGKEVFNQIEPPH